MEYICFEKRYRLNKSSWGENGERLRHQSWSRTFIKLSIKEMLFFLNFQKDRFLDSPLQGAFWRRPVYYTL